MGTRGAYGFHMGGKDKITYNHFDSYPTGLGEDVARFIRKHSDDEMYDTFKKIRLVESRGTPTKAQIDECIQYYDDRVSTQTPEDWYALLRWAQGNLEAHAEGLQYMIDNAAFLQDSLFCEWGYVINLDSRVLEIYRGFQTTPTNNRYSVDVPDDSGYYGCSLIRAVPFEVIRANIGYMSTLENEIVLEEGGL